MFRCYSYTIIRERINCCLLKLLLLKTIQLLKTMLNFTLKQLRHVSVLQLHHHQGAH